MNKVARTGRIGMLIVLIATSVGLVQGRTPTRAAPQETVITLSGNRLSTAGLTTADFNGDGYKEIVAGGSDGMLYVVSTSDGLNWSTVWSRQCNEDILAANPPTLKEENEIAATPAIADLDNDGHLDIVVAMGGDIHVLKENRENGGVLVYRYDSAWNFSMIEALSADGTRGWPQPRIDRVGDDAGYGSPDGFWDGIITSPALGDLDGDGDLEIVVAGIDRRIHAWHHSGEVVAGWPIYRDNGDALLRGGLSSPALGDIDGDGLPEVVVGTMSPPWGPDTPDPDYNLGTLWAINGDSTNVPNFPIETEQYIHSSPALGDIDGDGLLEIVVGVAWGTTGRENIVYAWNHDATPLPNWPRETKDVMYASPALGDIDNDGVPEVVIGCGNNYDVYSCGQGTAELYAWNGDGSSVWASPALPETPNPWASGSYAMPYTPILADLDGDGAIEILIGHLGAHGLTVVDSDGSTSDYSSHRFSGGLFQPPVVDDVDNDGFLEILVGGGETDAVTSRGVIRIWGENGDDSSSKPWPMFRHDVMRTGNLYMGDTTPPQNPSVSSPTHTPDVWSNDKQVQVNWTGADDAESGIAGYFYAWDTLATTEVDQSMDHLTPDVSSLSSGELSDSDSWYFHIRAQNQAGLLADNTVHFGPLKIDTVAPSSQLVAPACSVLSVTVSWSGADATSGIAGYNIQVRDASDGSWTDWKSGTTDTLDVYVGIAGHTFDFRSQAVDVAGNLEPLPADPDAQTWISQYGFSGSVYNVMGEPVFLAQVTATPATPLAVNSDMEGKYLLCYDDFGTYELDAARSDLGTLPSTPPLTGTLSGVDFYLPPADDLMVNGQFETGDLSAWSSTGTATGVVTDPVHSGDYAVQLSSTGDVPDPAAAISQSVFISNTLDNPTLSLAYLIEGNATFLLSDPAWVQVQGDVQTLTRTLPVSQGAWSRFTADLDAFRGQTVVLAVHLSNPSWRTALSSGRLVLDELSLGTVSLGVRQVYLPALLRQD